MQKMYEDYRDVAEFRLVYIREAHAADSDWSVGYAKDLGLLEHQNYGQRCSAAEKLFKDKSLTIPCVIDGMDNGANEAYKAHPDRVFLVRKDGRLAVAGKRGPWGFAPALDQTKAWLADYTKTGVEPGIEFAQAPPEKPKRSKGLNLWSTEEDSSESERRPSRWSDRAERPTRPERRGRSGSSDTLAAVAGDWDMKTDLNGQMIEAVMTLSVKNGSLAGKWASMGRDMELEEVRFSGGKLSFKRSIGDGQELTYEGTVRGDKLQGAYSTPFGELSSNGERVGLATRTTPVAPATPVAGSLLDGREKSFVVVGYSTSFAWPEMLQDMLNEHQGGSQVYHVLNAVVGGSPVERWIGEKGTDLYERTFGAMVGDYFGRDARLRRNAPEPTIALCQQSLQMTHAQLGPVNSVNDTEGIRIGADALEVLANRLHDLGIEKVLVAMHIYKQGYEPQVGNERFALNELLGRGHSFVFEGPDVWSLTIAEHPQAFAEDGLHPNEHGMKIMAEAWYRTLAGGDAKQDVIDRMKARDYDVDQMMRDYLATRRPGSGPIRDSIAAVPEEKPVDAGMSDRDRAQKIQELTGELIIASNSGERDGALSIALEALRHARILQSNGSGQARQYLSLTNYNAACMYSRMQRSDEAFEHLFEAIKSGSFNGRDLAGMIKDDSDFDNIRQDARYADALSRAEGARSNAGTPESDSPEFRGILGADSDKFKVVRGKTLLWASGDRKSADAKWYDFTGAPMPVEELQFGIGQDEIKAIDDPIFVDPYDPRLLELPISPYRSEEKPETNDDIMVIGYEVGGDHRAYPTALLDGHELVNDLVGGKPLTVGW